MLDSLSTYEIFLGRGVSETNITFWGSFKWPLPFERHYTRSREEVISSDDDNDKQDDNDNTMTMTKTMTNTMTMTMVIAVTMTMAVTRTKIMKMIKGWSLTISEACSWGVGG